MYQAFVNNFINSYIILVVKKRLLKTVLFRETPNVIGQHMIFVISFQVMQLLKEIAKKVCNVSTYAAIW